MMEGDGDQFERRVLVLLPTLQIRHALLTKLTRLGRIGQCLTMLPHLTEHLAQVQMRLSKALWVHCYRQCLPSSL
jgi:hypothetical protein